MELLYIIPALMVLWLFFLAVMTLDRANADGKLTPMVKPFAYVILSIGLVIDLHVQVMLTVFFLDLPREFTVSERLTRYKDKDTGWRHTVAIWFAKHFLDPFDRRGKHI